MLSALLALSTLASPGATSEPSDVVAARDAFRRGSALARSGDWQAALAAFEKSGRLKPHPVTSYDIAYCERALGHYARASFRFAEALVKAPEGGAALPVDLARDAANYLAEVRARVARVTLSRRPDDLTVRVDGMPLERMEPAEHAVYAVSASDVTAGELPRGPVEVWLDPGAHVFVASGPGDARTVENRTFASGETAELTLSLAEKAPSPPPAPHVDVAKPAPARPNHTAAFIAFGVAGVGLVGGTVFGGLSLAEKHSLDGDPACAAHQCPPSYRDREARMVTFADLATAGLVTLAAGAAAGTYFLLTGAPSRAKTARVFPWLAGPAVGIAGRF